eukprot:TRINITY_DN39264_c0_g1_i1.p1 TRINITY_DN39264_c0_g1~~TRINITY_DN39264_c0_g1_i1.p1  ORF type:complete len:1325 (-),score=234.78 TRINITY_DN39264_c0_g1_i1:43-3780(-)
MAVALQSVLQEKTGQPAPELISAVQHALRIHGADQGVVREAIRLCRSLTGIINLRTLLSNNLDKILQVGLASEELRDLAVGALGEWVDHLVPLKAPPTSWPEASDLGRFTAMLTGLVRSCLFDRTPQSLSFHQQVAEVLSDFCVSNGVGLAKILGPGELQQVWQALMHLLRYPCLQIQNNALVGMTQFAKATPGGGYNYANPGGGARTAGAVAHAAAIVAVQSGPCRPPLDELVGLLFVLQLRDELLPSLTTSMESGRSSWLLRCLGQVSTVQQPGSFEDWRQMIEMAHVFDLREGDCEDSVKERKNLLGMFKVRASRLCEIVFEPAPGGAAEPSNGWAQLCRHAGELVSRALAGGPTCVAEYEAAVFLVERVATGYLKEAEKLIERGFVGTTMLKDVLEPSLTFLRQATAEVLGPPGDPGSKGMELELRRLDLISHWGPLLRHFSEDVTGQVLQQLLRVIEKPPEDTTPFAKTAVLAGGGSLNIQRKALDTLVGLGKHGALRPQHMEALHAECARLAPKLTQTAKGKLCMALVGAIAATPRGLLTPARQIQLIEGLLDPATTAWKSSPLTQPPNPLTTDNVLAALVVGASEAAYTPSFDQEPHFEAMRSLKSLLEMFVGVFAKALGVEGHKSGSAAAAGTGAGDADMGADDATRPSAGGGEAPAEADGSNVTADLMGPVVQAWAPGVFALSQRLASLTAAASVALSQANGGSVGTLPEVLMMPSVYELDSMLGTGKRPSEEDEAVPPTSRLNSQVVEKVRAQIFDLQVITAKACAACVSSPVFWEIPQAGAWLRSLAEALRGQRPHVADLLVREVFGPLLGNNFKGPKRSRLLVVPAGMRQGLCLSVVPPLVDSLERVVLRCWCLKNKEGQEAIPVLPVPPALETAHAMATIALSRTAAQLLQELAGAGQVKAIEHADPERRLYPSQQRQVAPEPEPALPTPTPSTRKQKSRNKNRFAALAQDDGCAATAAAATPATAERKDETPLAIPSLTGAASFVLPDRDLRIAVLDALCGTFIQLPDPQTIKYALFGLATWSAQLWNCAARGENVGVKVGLDSSYGPGNLPEAGTLIHATSDALRPVPASMLKPLTRLVMQPPMPPGLGGDGQPSSSQAHALGSLVQGPWSSFLAASRVDRKLGPSDLVREVVNPIWCALRSITRLFRLQCKKLNLQVSLDQAYLCPSLVEASNIIRAMSNTTEADVKTLLESHLYNSMNAEDEKGAVRAVLHEASSGFAAAGGAAAECA